MRTKIKLVLLAGGIVAVVVGMLIQPGLVMAEGAVATERTPTNGVTVSPTILNITIDGAPQGREAAVAVRNDYDQPMDFAVALRGMEQVSNGKLLPSDTVEPSLAAVLAITPTSLHIQPHTSVNVKLTAIDSDDLAPGGHYATLMIRLVQPGDGGASGSLALSPVVSVALFVIKEAGAVRAVNVSSLLDDSRLWRPATSATTSFHNGGNVAVVPRGILTVADPQGKIIRSGVMNEGSLLLLPDGSLKLRGSMKSLAMEWLPGVYTTKLLYRYDGSDETQTVDVSHLVVPPVFAMVSLCVVLAIAWIVWRWGRLLLDWVRALRRPARRSKARQDVVEVRLPRSIDGIVARRASRTVKHKSE